MKWQVFDALGIALGFVANAVASLAGMLTGFHTEERHAEL